MTTILLFALFLIMFIIGCFRLIFGGIGEMHRLDHGTVHRKAVNRRTRRHFLITFAILAYAIYKLMTLA